MLKTTDKNKRFQLSHMSLMSVDKFAPRRCILIQSAANYYAPFTAEYAATHKLTFSRMPCFSYCLLNYLNHFIIARKAQEFDSHWSERRKEALEKRRFFSLSSVGPGGCSCYKWMAVYFIHSTANKRAHGNVSVDCILWGICIIYNLTQSTDNEWFALTLTAIQCNCCAHFLFPLWRLLPVL